MFIGFLNSVYGKATALFLAFTILCFTQATASNRGKTVVLKAGTAVMLELVSSVNANNVKTGDIVEFRVLNDVRAEGIVVISAGSIARGQVVTASKNGLFGSPAELSITVKSAVAVDGTYVPLMTSNLNSDGKDNLVVSIVVTVFCLFGFLIKGGKAELSGGAITDATVLSNTEISVE